MPRDLQHFRLIMTMIKWIHKESTMIKWMIKWIPYEST